MTEPARKTRDAAPVSEAQAQGAESRGGMKAPDHTIEAANARRSGNGTTRAIIEATMNPELGDDMLVPLGWVKERVLSRNAGFEAALDPDALRRVVAFIEREARNA